MKQLLLLSTLFNCIIFFNANAQKDPKITLEKIAEKCKDLPRNQRVTVKVARFSVSTKSAQANATFGDELATMLTSALQQTNCFRVLEMNKNVGDATGEMAFGQDGFTNGTSPEAGKMLGAQLIVTGEVTDFTEGKSSTSVIGFSVGSNQATVGFTLKVLNPQTGELLFSKDINMKGNSSGFSGMKILGVETVGSTQNRSVQDAMQKAIIKSVETLADEKDKMEIPEPLKPKEVKHYNADNCKMLSNGSPKVIILITEATTAGTSRSDDNTDLNRRERELALKERENNMNVTRDIVSGIFGKKKEEAKAKDTGSSQTSASAVYKPVVIEQSATETELTRHFVEAGFRVVDPKVYGKMRKIADSTADLGSMAALGLKMGANIIITGQTISERTNTQGGMTSCRASLEIKVIATEDGSILATNTVAGGGIDVSEAIANKIAIKNASVNMSQYLMDRLCTMNIQFAGVAPATKSKASSSTTSNITSIVLTNVNFSQMQTIMNHLKTNNKIKEVKKSLSGNKGNMEISHTTTTDFIAEFLSECKTLKIEITGLNGNTVEAMIK